MASRRRIRQNARNNGEDAMRHGLLAFMVAFVVMPAHADDMVLRGMGSFHIGGRIAEEIILGPEKVTTGASNDIERATDIARNMVTRWGLSDKLGPLAYTEDEGEVFLGKSVTQTKNISDETAHTIDVEIRKIIDHNYARAKQILVDNIDKLHVMAKALIKYETIDAAQDKRIMAGEDPGVPESWNDSSNPGGGGSSPAQPAGGPAPKPAGGSPQPASQQT